MAVRIPTKRQILNEWRLGGPVVVRAVIVACAAVWVATTLLRLLSPRLYSTVVAAGMFSPITAVTHPWTWLTSMFLHSWNPLHVLFNMVALYSVGPLLERLMGHWRFLALYVVSGLGGAAGIMVWARLTGGWFMAAYGASGAIFGLFAALLVVYRHVGADLRAMLVWMAINFLLPLVVGGIAWQAHVGGFLVGGALTWLLVRGVPALRRRSLAVRMGVYGGAMAALLVVVIVACSPLAML